MNGRSPWVSWFSVAALTGSMVIGVAGRGEELDSQLRLGDTIASVAPDAKPVDATGGRDTRREFPGEGDPAARLQYVLDFARDAYGRIGQDIQDYECQLYRQERVEGRLTNPQLLSIKVRHERKDGDKVVVPLSVFVQFLKPGPLEGREVLFIQDQPQSELIARRGGNRSPNMTVRLLPGSPMAMEGNRYPITEIGFQNLTKRLIEVLEQEQKHNDCVIEIFPQAKVDGRKCTHFRLTHHQRRPDLTYHKAEVSVDDELKIPIYFRSYDWPVEENGAPRLLEEYFYKRVKLNVGLTERDFDYHNPDYHFQLREDGATNTDGSEAPREGTPLEMRSSENVPGQSASISSARSIGEPVICGMLA